MQALPSNSATTSNHASAMNWVLPITPFILDWIFLLFFHSLFGFDSPTDQKNIFVNILYPSVYFVTQFILYMLSLSSILRSSEVRHFFDPNTRPSTNLFYCRMTLHANVSDRTLRKWDLFLIWFESVWANRLYIILSKRINNALYIRFEICVLENLFVTFFLWETDLDVFFISDLWPLLQLRKKSSKKITKNYYLFLNKWLLLDFLFVSFSETKINMSNTIYI